VQQLLDRDGRFQAVQTAKDLAGLPRVIRGKRR